ncbi:DUF2529 domain-containing protein [Niallia oryzisoli]|uniref:DUF2529 domain-containing protein n=1 Tax=Niallia oryzisoli TaxID=1737571 RepID=A0ABZ2CC32_9BACI
MLKIFATQLNGLFTKIRDEQMEEIEDSARLLAQAVIADGKIYVYGAAEMESVASEAVNGAEPLTHAAAMTTADIDSINSVDRVLLVTRYSTDKEALEMAKKLADHGISFVTLSTHQESDEESITDLADVSIDLSLHKGLVPADDGSRIGYPFSMAALYAYYGLKFTIDEILADY